MAQNAPQPLTPAQALQVLARVAAFHPPTDLGDGTVAAWRAALTVGGVTSVTDAITAVVAYYANPDNHDVWIKPWHVIQGVREIRRERVRLGPSVAELTADLDPDDPAWSAIMAARHRAVAEGRPWRDAR